MTEYDYLRFNSRYAGKIHQMALSSSVPGGRVSIPAMRVRYIAFRSPRMALMVVSIPAMRVRYISKNNGKHYH